MNNTVVEIATITLKPGKTETQLLAASDVFQMDFVKGMKGFIRRELVHLKDNEYADIIHWQTKKDADAVMEKAMSSDACMAFFSLMEMDEANPEGGVTHYKSLATYG